MWLHRMKECLEAALGRVFSPKTNPLHRHPTLHTMPPFKNQITSQLPNSIFRLVGSFGPPTMDIPNQHFTPTEKYFLRQPASQLDPSDSNQMPPKEIQATFSGGYMLRAKSGSLFGFGNNSVGEIGIESPYSEHWMRPRFNIDAQRYQIKALQWFKCSSVATFACVRCWNHQEAREELLLCATGNSKDGLLGSIASQTSAGLHSASASPSSRMTQRRLERALAVGANVRGANPKADPILRAFTPLHIPLADPKNEVFLGVESQGTSTIVWTQRPDGTNGFYVSGLNMSHELSSKAENLRAFTDLSHEFRRDLPSDDVTIHDIKKTLTTTQILLSNGRVYARGRGRNSELGTGKLAELHLAEVDIPYAEGERVERIFAGPNHTMALTKVRDPHSGYEVNRLFEWGVGNFSGKKIVGQSTDPNYTEPDAQRFGVREITHHYISREDPIVDVSIGANMTYVITQSGKIYCAGSARDGQFGVELESKEAPPLGHYKNMSQYLVPPDEKIVDIICSQSSALLWTAKREQV